MKGEPVKNIEGIKRKISHLKRAKRKMNFPKDPEEFANAMEDLVHNITPRKREKSIEYPYIKKKVEVFLEIL